MLLARNHTLKRALTDPGLFSGIGNAYSDEILHRARLSPIKLTSRLTGQEVFSREVYYFSEIPTEISPVSIVLLNLGAIAIAVFFSVLPALKAAWLHPVRALRYE